MTTSQQPGSPRTSGVRPGVWVLVVSLVVVAVLVVVWALSRGDTNGTAGPTIPPASSATTGPTAGPTDVPTSAPSDAPTAGPTTRPTTGAGCAPGGPRVPPGADVAPVADVDGDGRPDEAWLSTGPARRFGIRTASGATFDTPVDSASPIAAAAVVGIVQAERLPIAIVDTGREAMLLTLVDCAAEPVVDEHGEPYRFDRGFSGYGTGVGCTEVDGGRLRLAGLDAVSDDQGATFDVRRTWVDLDPTGHVATNGADEVVARDAAADSAVVRTAQEVSCGDALAGRDGPVQPKE